MILDFTTAAGIRRAVPVLARQVAARRMAYSAALDLLTRAFVVHVWNGAKMRTLAQAEARLGQLLGDACAAADAVARAHPLAERLMAGERFAVARRGSQA